MKKIILALVLSAGMLGVNSANADFGISLRLSDFSKAPIVFNDVTRMDFDLIFAGGLIAGKTYDTSDLASIEYKLDGVLASPTPSMFPQFFLRRGPMPGTEFDGLSADSSVNFAISAGANLSDGLQMSELVGFGTANPVFTINAREVNVDPGRYHPPIFTLNGDLSGKILNAANNSTFPNPPPMNGGNGMIVNVQEGEEYIVDFTYNSNLTLAVPEPGSAGILAGFFGVIALRRRRK